jgi:site-specific DNA-methyltransferase (adenine-specific)
MKKEVKLMLGDNISSLKKLPENSIDSVVTDPPYGLSFMGKKWDYDVPLVDFWKEVYRVLKPGGHVLSFGGTRTYHRMTVNIEDAGFEIRDQIMWLYGSGFPKSHNIGKAVDKLQGNEREVVGEQIIPYKDESRSVLQPKDGWNDNSMKTRFDITKGQSPYEGWGTALKPANEPICVARKPLSEKSVALNVLKWGTGGINIDGCRVGSETIMTNMKNTKGGLYNLSNEERTNEVENTFNEGRFPANIILECICDEVIKGEKGEIKRSNNGTSKYYPEQNTLNKGVETQHYNDKGDIHTNPMCPCYMLDEQSGLLSGQVGMKRVSGQKQLFNEVGTELNKQEFKTGKSDKGGASRFFYQAKVSKAERNMGLDGFEDKETNGSIGLHSVGGAPTKDNKRVMKNTHPTVKPVALMSYLCRLVTPPNGIVLDPFMGSGSTGIAARLEGFRFCGMEMDEDYFKITEARINDYESYRKFLNKK